MLIYAAAWGLFICTDKVRASTGPCNKIVPVATRRELVLLQGFHTIFLGSWFLPILPRILFDFPESFFNFPESFLSSFQEFHPRSGGRDWADVARTATGRLRSRDETEGEAPSAPT